MLALNQTKYYSIQSLRIVFQSEALQLLGDWMLENFCLIILSNIKKTPVFPIPNFKFRRIFGVGPLPPHFPGTWKPRIYLCYHFRHQSSNADINHREKSCSLMMNLNNCIQRQPWQSLKFITYYFSGGNFRFCKLAIQ